MQERPSGLMPVTPQMEQTASLRARVRAKNARWDLDMAVFLFGLMIVIIILLFQRIILELVSGVAALGLSAVWLGGYRREKRLYRLFYDEEIFRLQNAGRAMEETIEDRIQKALRERVH